MPAIVNDRTDLDECRGQRVVDGVGKPVEEQAAKPAIDDWPSFGSLFQESKQVVEFGLQLPAQTVALSLVP